MFQLVELSIHDLNTKGPWLAWSEAPSPLLQHSVRCHGVLHPVLVDASASQPALVDGWGRLQILQAAGQRTILCLDIGPATPQDRFFHHLAANLHKPRTEARLVAAARAAQRLEVPWEALWSVLGLAPRSREVRLTQAWVQLPLAWDPLLAGGQACLAAAEHLADLASQDHDALFPLVAAYGWSQSALIQLLTLLVHIQRRDQLPLAAIVERLDMDGGRHLSPKDAMERLLQRARHIRYPERTRLEAQWQKAARNIPLPTPWRMERTDAFETVGVELRATVRSPEEVRQAASALQGCAASSAWDQLFAVGEA